MNFREYIFSTKRYFVRLLSFLFMCMSVLHRMSVSTSMQYLWNIEEGTGSPGLKLQIVLSYHVGAGN